MAASQGMASNGLDGSQDVVSMLGNIQVSNTAIVMPVVSTGMYAAHLEVQ